MPSWQVVTKKKVKNLQFYINSSKNFFLFFEETKKFLFFEEKDIKLKVINISRKNKILFIMVGDMNLMSDEEIEFFMTWFPKKEDYEIEIQVLPDETLAEKIQRSEFSMVS